MQKLNDVVTDAVGKAIICEVLETYAWKPVSGYKELPVGEWLVKIGNKHHVAVIRETAGISTIGGHLAFAREAPVTHYRRL